MAVVLNIWANLLFLRLGLISFAAQSFFKMDKGAVDTEMMAEWAQQHLVRKTQPIKKVVWVAKLNYNPGWQVQ